MVLVGHSYGGAVVTNVDADAGQVVATVYVAGFALEPGESCADASALVPGSTLGDTLVSVPLADGGTDTYIAQEKFHHQFGADLQPAQAAEMAVTQRPVTAAALAEPSGDEPLWRSVPSWFLFGELDHNIPAGAHHLMADRAGTRSTVEIAGASHVVGISHPAETLQIILEAAGARSLLVGGAGAALVGAAAAVIPGTAAAADDPSAGRHAGFETRIKVAPCVHVNVADLDGGPKGTVVLVPGWPLASTTLEYASLFLADHGYRAVALDLRGFGTSDAPYGPYTYDVWAHDIGEVLKALSLRKVTLVEASAPHCVYGPTSADLAAGIAGLISGYADDRTAVIRALTKNFFATHTDVTTDPFLPFFERQCLDQASLQASRAGLVALRDTDLVGDLARVSVPTRIFHARNDRVVPYDHGQALAAGIKGARLVTFETAGHGVYVDERDKFNAELLAFARS